MDWETSSTKRSPEVCSVAVYELCFQLSAASRLRAASVCVWSLPPVYFIQALENLLPPFLPLAAETRSPHGTGTLIGNGVGGKKRLQNAIDDPSPPCFGSVYLI